MQFLKNMFLDTLDNFTTSSGMKKLYLKIFTGLFISLLVLGFLFIGLIAFHAKGFIAQNFDGQVNAEIILEFYEIYLPFLCLQFLFLAFPMALLVGFIFTWMITKNLRIYIQIVSQFKNGDLSARACSKCTGDFPILAQTFNDMADEVAQNIEKLKHSEKLRRELIANISHDLRTPITVIQGYAETLKIKKESSFQSLEDTYLNIILKSSKKLARLVAQLFEYSNLEAKQIEPKKESLQLTDLLQDIFLNYELLAKNKNINLKIEHEENIPLIFADIVLVERVIQNLMDNALKFTPEQGLITIHLKNTIEGVQLEISNSGLGIPKEQQALIFDRYQKMKTTNVKINKGAGLGLCIVKKILELHNATISVRSKLNEGATFTIMLPSYS